MYLCIDTATKEAGITLVDDQKSYGYLPLEENHYADGIIGHIDQLLDDVKNLKAVFVIVGPGSFTGLRVGIAVANQFAHQLDIPIIGLRTDEWWAHRTDETDYLFLQTMNKAEVYTSDGIKPIESVKGNKWIGEVSDEHRTKLQELSEIQDIRSPEETWLKVVQDSKIKAREKYDLLEPFYGKEPTITKSKKKLSIWLKILPFWIDIVFYFLFEFFSIELFSVGANKFGIEFHVFEFLNGST